VIYGVIVVCDIWCDCGVIVVSNIWCCGVIVFCD
jgi:hypothetical protein